MLISSGTKSNEHFAKLLKFSQNKDVNYGSPKMTKHNRTLPNVVNGNTSTLSHIRKETNNLPMVMLSESVVGIVETSMFYSNTPFCIDGKKINTPYYKI